MKITKIDRIEKIIKITKNNGKKISLNFNELDELIDFLHKISYINYHLDLKYNHYLSKIEFVEMTNGKWNIKTL